MNKIKLNQFRSQLKSIRFELLGDVKKSNQHVKESETGQIADISDHAARTYNRQLEGELDEQEWQKLKQVDVVIEKIAKGEFGVCTQCLSEMEKSSRATSLNDKKNPFQED